MPPPSPSTPTRPVRRSRRPGSSWAWSTRRPSTASSSRRTCSAADLTKVESLIHAISLLEDRFDAALPGQVEKLERRPTRLLRTPLPLTHQRCGDIEREGEDSLAHTRTFA